MKKTITISNKGNETIILSKPSKDRFLFTEPQERISLMPTEIFEPIWNKKKKRFDNFKKIK